MVLGRAGNSQPASTITQGGKTMGLSDIVPSASTSPFTAEDRKRHVSVYAERTFGRPVEQLGQVEGDERGAWLVFDWGGQRHTLEWGRLPGGSIVWYLDGGATPLHLGPSDRAGAQLAAILGNPQ